MKSFNLVVLMGNLTRDVDIRYIPSGAAIGAFSLALNREWFDASTKEKKTACSFIDCKIWGKSAENLAQYAKKGSPLHLSGRLEQESWDDKQSGQKRSKIVVVVEEFSFIGGGEQSNAHAPAMARPPQRQSTSVKPKESQPELQPTEPDDVPF